MKFRLSRDIELLDRRVVEECRRFKGLKWLLRIGSSLSGNMTSSSDIDYVVICDLVRPVDFNRFRWRKFGDSDRCLKDGYFPSYWKSFGEYMGRKLEFCFYSVDRFMELAYERSAPIMYILNENKVLAGSRRKFKELKKKFRPNGTTVKNEVLYLVGSGVRGFKTQRSSVLWSWRSLSLKRRKKWLKNQIEVCQFIHEYYPECLEDYLFLKENPYECERNRLIIERFRELLVNGLR